MNEISWVKSEAHPLIDLEDHDDVARMMLRSAIARQEPMWARARRMVGLPERSAIEERAVMLAAIDGDMLLEEMKRSVMLAGF